MKISYSLKALATAVANILTAGGLNVSKWAGTAVAARDTEGYPKVTVKNGTGTGEISLLAGIVAPRIKSVQYGTVTITAGNSTGTATLSPSVNAAKSILIFLGNDLGNTDTGNHVSGFMRITLTDGSTVTATRQGVAGGNHVGSFCVVEFW